MHSFCFLLLFLGFRLSSSKGPVVFRVKFGVIIFYGELSLEPVKKKKLVLYFIIIKIITIPKRYKITWEHEIFY